MIIKKTKELEKGDVYRVLGDRYYKIMGKFKADDGSYYLIIKTELNSNEKWTLRNISEDAEWEVINN